MSEDITKRLSQLPPDARARVEEALKANIEAELAANISPRAAGDFSRGIIFSKVVHNELTQDALIRQAAFTDEATFNTFVDRLTKIRDLKTRTEGTQ